MACHDNNIATGACSNDCKTVTQLERCLRAIDLRDECSKCICENCVGATNDCYAGPNPEQNNQCVRLARCVREELQRR